MLCFMAAEIDSRAFPIKAVTEISSLRHGHGEECFSCTRPPRWPVRRSPRERKIPGSNPTCTGIFSGSSHTSDLKIGTPVATLTGVWRYRVSIGSGRPGVSML